MERAFPISTSNRGAPPCTSQLAKQRRSIYLALTLAVVAVGLSLRCYHYGRAPSVWHDEAALIVNVLERDFGQLLGPLTFSEAAPPLFLWLEKAITLVFGEGVYALRAVPFLASCASLVALTVLSRRRLEPAAWPCAALLLACSDRLLWHGCEAKQYSVEVLVAILLLLVYEQLKVWPICRRQIAFACLAPVVIWLAYPAVFLFGGVAIAFLIEVWSLRQRSAWLGFVILCLVIVVSFAFLVLGPIAEQRDVHIVNCWARMGKFPDLQRAETVPIWTITSSADLFGYCFRPIGHLCLPLAVVGGILLYQHYGARWLALLVVPILLAYVASFLRAYPFGGSRVMAYCAPALAMLAAAGIPPTMRWLRSRNQLATGLLFIFLAIMPGWAVYRIVVPWDRADSDRAAAFVLANRSVNDLVTSNHWEYRYYFRKLEMTHVPLQDFSVPAVERFWVVATAAEARDRNEIIEQLKGGKWRIITQREFRRTSVVLLKRENTRPDAVTIGTVLTRSRATSVK